jgi:hypothetical protein
LPGPHHSSQNAAGKFALKVEHSRTDSLDKRQTLELFVIGMQMSNFNKEKLLRSKTDELLLVAVAEAADASEVSGGSTLEPLSAAKGKKPAANDFHSLNFERVVNQYFIMEQV